MKRALVTGAAGFLGSHVADELLALGVSVVAMDDLSGGFWRNLSSIPMLFPHEKTRLSPLWMTSMRSPHFATARSRPSSVLALSGTITSEENGRGSAKMLSRHAVSNPPEL